MRNDRIYKALPIRTFMEQSSFVLAKGGYYAGALISDFNHEMTFDRMKKMSDTELQHIFIGYVTKDVRSAGLNIRIADMGEYYDVWTEYSKERPKKYDIVLKEKMLDAGLIKDEILAQFDLLNNESAFPLDFQAESSSAMGFITEKAAEELDYDIQELQEMIQGILNDMEKESESCEYEFKGFKIWLSR